MSENRGRSIFVGPILDNARAGSCLYAAVRPQQIPEGFLIYFVSRMRPLEEADPSLGRVLAVCDSMCGPLTWPGPQPVCQDINAAYTHVTADVWALHDRIGGVSFQGIEAAIRGYNLAPFYATVDGWTRPAYALRGEFLTELRFPLARVLQKLIEDRDKFCDEPYTLVSNFRRHCEWLLARTSQ